MAAKLAEDRYIVLFPCHVIREQEPKTQRTRSKTTKTKTNTNKNNPHKTQKTTPQSSDVTDTSLGEKDLLRKEVIA